MDSQTIAEFERCEKYTVGQKYTNGMNGDFVTTGMDGGGVCANCQTVAPDVKLLPCLHMSCMECVHKCINDTCLGQNDTALYSCPSCGHKVNISNIENASRIFKTVPSFLMKGDTIELNIKNTGCSENGSSLNDMINCDDCTDSFPSNKSVVCRQCSKNICSSCQMQNHEEHQTLSMLDFIQSKIDYIQTLIGGISDKMLNHKEGLSCIDRVKNYLNCTKDDIRQDIMKRADYLISLVNQRKTAMLQELDDTFTANVKSYAQMEEKLNKELKRFQFVQKFSEDLVNSGCDRDIMSFYGEASNQCLHQLHQVADASVDVVSMKLDIPGRGKEQATLEKLFGSLKEGTVLAGSAELMASFSVDLKWPTSIAVSSGKEVVVTGKTGTFESEGKAFFFDSRGRFHSKVNFDPQHVPMDVCPAGDGTVWLSNSAGELQNMTVAGRVLRTVPQVFQGSGYLGVLNDSSLVITSASSRQVRILDELGQFIRSVTVPNPEDASKENDFSNIKLNCLTTQSDDTIILGDTEGCRVMGLSMDGTLQFTYNSNDISGPTPALKCPSALCCDPFDNILVADFTNDNIHLLSKSGSFLGCLLSRENGLSCPNCLAMDSEGRLYIGQYGGDILMFSYMSCTKKI